MATLHDLEQTIVVFLASNYAAAICQLDGTETRAKETSDRLIAAREEVEALLAENTSLRADIDGLESVIHELVEDRWWKRYHMGNADNLANTYRQERDDARQTIGLVRLECERLHKDNEKLLRKLHTARGFGGKGVAKKAKGK